MPARRVVNRQLIKEHLNRIQPGNTTNLYEGLTTGRADAALAASIFHFGEHTVPEAKAYLAARGVPVRLEEAVP